MSGEINVTDPDKPKRILMVIANPATSTTLGIRSASGVQN
jgi:hypothetical protein